MLASAPPAVIATLDNQILWLVLASLCLTLLLYEARRLWPRVQVSLVGPIFWYDLARLARRNRTALLRFVYGLFLMAWLYVALSASFPGYSHYRMWFQPGPRVSPSVMAGFAINAVAAVVGVQGAAVFVVTPAYLANAIAEESESGTLELLFTTPLLDREIVLGKLLGRVTHMGMILYFLNDRSAGQNHARQPTTQDAVDSAPLLHVGRIPKEIQIGAKGRAGNHLSRTRCTCRR